VPLPVFLIYFRPFKSPLFLMKTLRHHRLLLGWFMTVLLFFSQAITPLQAATFYWAPDIGGGPDSQEGGNWDTTSLNWWDSTSYDSPAGGASWSNLGAHTAVFGNFGIGPSSVNFTEAISVGGLVFDSSGVNLQAFSALETLNFAGATPTITIKGDSFSGDTEISINAGLTGTNGLTIEFDDASTFLGPNFAVLRLGAAGSGYASTLSGGITVGEKVVLAVDVASDDLSAGRNPLGSNLITLQAGSELNIIGTTSTPNGLSGRVFDTSGVGNSSRVDFTGMAVSAQTNSSLNNLNNVPASTAVQWLGKVSIGTAGAYSFFASVDDGGRVYIDGVLVLNNDGGKGNTDLSSAPIFLSSGMHDIRIDYVQGSGGGNINLAYAGPDTDEGNGQIRKVIPSSSFEAGRSQWTFWCKQRVATQQRVASDG
jgi:hypothetical protein